MQSPADLATCFRDLHLIFAIHFLESFNYFSLSLAFVLFLTDEFNIGDVQVSNRSSSSSQVSFWRRVHSFATLQAGSYYGLWGTLLFVYGIPVGGLIDWLGEAAFQFTRYAVLAES